MTVLRGWTLAEQAEPLAHFTPDHTPDPALDAMVAKMLTAAAEEEVARADWDAHYHKLEPRDWDNTR